MRWLPGPAEGTGRALHLVTDPFYKSAVLSALAPLESNDFCYSVVYCMRQNPHYSSAKTLYFGNSRISNRQKSIPLYPSYTKAFASLLIPSSRVIQICGHALLPQSTIPRSLRTPAKGRRTKAGVAELDGWPGLQLHFSIRVDL